MRRLPHGPQPGAARGGKPDVWLVYWIFPGFYAVFGVIICLLTRVTPPPRPDVSTVQKVEFFAQHHSMIQIGFCLLLVLLGGAAITNGPVGYHMTEATKTRAGTSTRTITVTWLALTAITIGSWWLAPGHSTTTVGASVPITVLVLALAAVKCRLIIRTFMEVRGAPRWLRWATDGWLVALIAAALVLYLI